MQNLAGRSTSHAVHVTVTEVAPVQQLDDASQIGVAQPARDLRRGHPNLLELRVGEGDRRHLFESSQLEKWGSRPVLGEEEVDQTRQALLEIYCAVVPETPYNDFGTH